MKYLALIFIFFCSCEHDDKQRHIETCPEIKCPSCSDAIDTYKSLYTIRSKQSDDCQYEKQSLEEKLKKANDDADYWKRRYDDFNCN